MNTLTRKRIPMSIRRFTRLTNAFSKKIENHALSVALHYMHYNIVRIRKTLRVTPAMAAGVSDHVWTIDEIVGLLNKLRLSQNDALPNLKGIAVLLSNMVATPERVEIAPHCGSKFHLPRIAKLLKATADRKAAPVQRMGVQRARGLATGKRAAFGSFACAWRGPDDRAWNAHAFFSSGT